MHTEPNDYNHIKPQAKDLTLIFLFSFSGKRLLCQGIRGLFSNEY